MKEKSKNEIRYEEAAAILDNERFSRLSQAIDCFKRLCDSEDEVSRCKADYASMLVSEMFEEDARCKFAVINKFKIVSIEHPLKTIAQFKTKKEAEAQLANYAGAKWLKVFEYAGMLPEDK